MAGIADILAKVPEVATALSDASVSGQQVAPIRLEVLIIAGSLAVLEELEAGA